MISKIEASEQWGSPTQNEALAVAFARATATLRRQGLDHADAEDAAQELLGWLLVRGRLADTLSPGIIAGFARRYARRFWRRRSSRGRHEVRCAERGTDPRDPARRDIDLSVSLDKIERILPGREASIVRSMREGSTWAEATAKVGIRKGSRSWMKSRLAGRVGRLLRRS